MLAASLTAAVSTQAQTAAAQHITQAELSATLTQYQNVRQMQMDTQLERELLAFDASTLAEKLALLEKRTAVLDWEVKKLASAVETPIEEAKEKPDHLANEAEKAREVAGVIDPDINDPKALISRTGSRDPEQCGKVPTYVEAKLRYVQSQRNFEALQNVATAKS